jgi:hypothetical protein
MLAAEQAGKQRVAENASASGGPLPVVSTDWLKSAGAGVEWALGME